MKKNIKHFIFLMAAVLIGNVSYADIPPINRNESLFISGIFKTKKISVKTPSEYTNVDIDKDDNISSSEIEKTIDDFFEEKNSITIDNINKLIEFFFEH